MSFRLALGLTSAILLLIAWPAMAEVTDSTSQTWEATATRAETLLQLPPPRRDRITSEQWEELRLQLTLQREEALEQTSHGSLGSRIAAAQLKELGAAAKGQPEPEWMRTRRAALNAELAADQAPVMAARDFHARSSVLISDIDEILRKQRSRDLFANRNSVLLVQTWRAAGSQVSTLLSAALPAGGAFSAAARFVVAFAAGIVALWLAFRVRRRTRVMIDRRSQASTVPARRLGFAFLRDLIDIAAPALALLFVHLLLRSMPDQLPVLAAIGGRVTLAGMTVIFARWLGHSIFEPAFPPGRLLTLPEGKLGNAITLMALLGATLAANTLRQDVRLLPGSAPALDAIISLAIIVFGAACIWRLTALLRLARPGRQAGTNAEAGSHRGDMLSSVILFLRIIAILAVLAAMTGYSKLSQYLLISTLTSFATAATALFLFRSLTEASGLLFMAPGQPQSRYMQVVPLVFGFVLLIATLPLIALMWGVSGERVIDLVLAFKNGVALGDIRISFGSVMTFALVFLFGYILTRWIQRIVHFAVLDRLRVDVGASSAILTGTGYLGLTLSALVAITAAGLDLSSLAFIAGALSVGIGFGLQSVVANFVSGIILLIERPIKQGDWIEVAGYSGHVRKVAFRSTHIETADRHEVIIPNNELVAGSVKNLTYGDSEGRIVLPIGVAYGSDLEKVRKLLVDIAVSHEKVLGDPLPRVVIDALGDNAINLNLLCFVGDVNQRLTVRSDLYFVIVKALDDAGISIPYPQRELWIHDVRDTQGA
ncbi:mechanosensitive ion channel domain-containing protein [Novosphingobium sp.]|uniref:mechanosensitive ion channel family protein n=1 Tax=Novosphingobium sp. TaxID=1874826 RepID=UPI0028AAD8BC|nr:mechanosensitive ion channel domain-containing protein [Novosphingobium sp.]